MQASEAKIKVYETRMDHKIKKKFVKQLNTRFLVVTD